MQMETSYKFSSDAIKLAIVEARGNLTQAAHLISQRPGSEKCSRTYLAEALKKRVDLAAFYQAFREEIVDKAEGNIFTLVDEGDYNASVLVVRTLGKERGWVPKEEVDAKVDASALLSKMQAARERARGALTSEVKSDEAAQSEVSG